MDLSKLEHAFDLARAELLETHESGWALMGTWDPTVEVLPSEQAAIDRGFEQSRGSQFLVKELLAEDRIVTVSLASLSNRLL